MVALPICINKDNIDLRLTANDFDRLDDRSRGRIICPVGTRGIASVRKFAFALYLVVAESLPYSNVLTLSAYMDVMKAWMSRSDDGPPATERDDHTSAANMRVNLLAWVIWLDRPQGTPDAAISRRASSQ